MPSASDRGVERVTRDVTARGTRMRVLEAGLGQSTPLVLIHGLWTSHLEFDDIIDPLAQRFHVIAPDLPGFGDSETPISSKYAYGVEAFSEAVADIIAAYGLGRAAVLGHYLGGAVAITLATHHAELVTRLALVAPLCYPAPLGWQLRLPLLPVVGSVVFKQLYGRALFRRYFQRVVFSRGAHFPSSRVDRWYADFNRPAARESAHAVLRAILDTRSVIARLPRVVHPTLVLWGRDDAVVPATHALKLAREIPNARLELFDTGHSPHEERPGEFVFTITEFVEGRR